MLHPGESGSICSPSAKAKPARSYSSSTERTTPCMEVEMKSASWTLVLCVVLTAATRAGSQGVGQGSDAPQTPSRDAVRLTAYQRGGAGRGLSVRWIGQ